MSRLIEGKIVSAAVKRRVKERVDALSRSGIKVCLAVILVGEDPASRIYVSNKHKTCLELGIESKQILLPESTSEEELLELIDSLNADSTVNGILCQLPLPSHIDEGTVTAHIDPAKDVDAFHPVNAGKIMTGGYDFVPCTPAGIMEMLSYYDIDPSGKSCVVIGRSNIVGKPMAMLLLHKNGTVTICHSKTRELSSVTRGADILVAAVGRAGFVTADMVKPGAVVIDVGMNRADGKLCGDVKFDEVEPIASYITPVPGGVGPMTIAMLMKNTVTAAERQNNIPEV